MENEERILFVRIMNKDTTIYFLKRTLMSRRPSDQEFSLKRKIKELEEQNHKLEDENKKLKKQADKTAPKEAFSKKPGKVIQKPCPDCGAQLNVTDMPHAVMELCSAACGHRNVRSKK